MTHPERSCWHKIRYSENQARKIVREHRRETKRRCKRKRTTMIAYPCREEECKRYEYWHIGHDGMEHTPYTKRPKHKVDYRKEILE